MKGLQGTINFFAAAAHSGGQEDYFLPSVFISFREPVEYYYYYFGVIFKNMHDLEASGYRYSFR